MSTAAASPRVRARAAVVLHTSEGHICYINDIQVAERFLEKLVPRQVVDPILSDRIVAASAAIVAHDAVTDIAGAPAHNLGVATRSVRHVLSKSECLALRSIRRKANAAKHDWVKDCRTDTSSTGAGGDDEVSSRAGLDVADWYEQSDDAALREAAKEKEVEGGRGTTIQEEATLRKAAKE